MQLHDRARPAREVDEEPAEVEPDEFGMTDGLLDDEPNAAWSMRLKLEAETTAIRARYAAEIQHWQSVYRRNPGPAPKLTEITRKMQAEIREVERRYYLQEARELAAADHASGRAQARAQERHKAIRNMQEFGRDIRGARFEPVEVSKATEDIFTFPGRRQSSAATPRCSGRARSPGRCTTRIRTAPMASPTESGVATSGAMSATRGGGSGPAAVSWLSGPQVSDN